MNYKSTIAASFIISLFLPISALAQTPTAPPKQAEAKATSSADLTQGEVQKVDKEGGKLTIKHGEIKNLNMPGMTMAFPTKDKAMIGNIKAGDKIRFKAVDDNGKIVVTEIQPDK